MGLLKTRKHAVQVRGSSIEKFEESKKNKTTTTIVCVATILANSVFGNCRSSHFFEKVHFAWMIITRVYDVICSIAGRDPWP